MRFNDFSLIAQHLAEKFQIHWIKCSLHAVYMLHSDFLLHEIQWGCCVTAKNKIRHSFYMRISQARGPDQRESSRGLTTPRLLRHYIS